MILKTKVQNFAQKPHEFSFWYQHSWTMYWVKILRVETSSNNHPTKVPEAMLPAHDKEGLVEIRMVLPQLLLLDFPARPRNHRHKTSYCTLIVPVILHECVCLCVHTFSSQPVLSFLGSSWSRCLLSGRCGSVPCWSAGKREGTMNDI